MTSHNQHFKVQKTYIRSISYVFQAWQQARLYWTPHVEKMAPCGSSSSVDKSSETASLSFGLLLTHHLLLHHKWKPSSLAEVTCWASKFQRTWRASQINAGRSRQSSTWPQKAALTVRTCFYSFFLFVFFLLLLNPVRLWKCQMWW